MFKTILSDSSVFMLFMLVPESNKTFNMIFHGVHGERAAGKHRPPFLGAVLRWPNGNLEPGQSILGHPCF